MRLGAARGSGVLVLTLVLLTAASQDVQARNFSALLTNPISLLQQAGQSMMSTLMRSRPTVVEPRPSAERRGEAQPGDMADRVASLVKDGLNGKKQNKKQPFQKQQQQQQQQQQQDGGASSGLFGGFMRLLGLDSTRLGAIAINAFVYVSEMIAATLTRVKPTNRREDIDKPEGSPFSWLLDNPGPKVAEALRLAQSRELPEILISLLKGRAKRAAPDAEPEGETWCLQRLMCQLSPVLWGMQQAVSETISPSPSFQEETGPAYTALWQHLPTREVLRTQGDACEKRFPDCDLPQGSTD